MDESNDVPTLDFPSIPTPPGFYRIIRPGDTPEPVSSPFLFDSSPELPGWYPLTHTLMSGMGRLCHHRLVQLPVCLRVFRTFACLPLFRWCLMSLMGMRDSAGFIPPSAT